MIRANLWAIAALIMIFGAGCGSADGSNPSGDYRIVSQTEEDTEDFASVYAVTGARSEEEMEAVVESMVADHEDLDGLRAQIFLREEDIATPEEMSGDPIGNLLAAYTAQGAAMTGLEEGRYEFDYVATFDEIIHE